MRFGVQVHNKLKRQNCGAAGIAVDEERVYRNLRRMPFGHEWVGRQQAVKAHRRLCGQSSYALRTIFMPKSGRKIFLLNLTD
nr:hypothetical protein [uncultured Agathobaculum sp.]